MAIMQIHGWHGTAEILGTLREVRFDKHGLHIEGMTLAEANDVVGTLATGRFPAVTPAGERVQGERLVMTAIDEAAGATKLDVPPGTGKEAEPAGDGMGGGPEYTPGNGTETPAKAPPAETRAERRTASNGAAKPTEKPAEGDPWGLHEPPKGGRNGAAAAKASVEAKNEVNQDTKPESCGAVRPGADPSTACLKPKGHDGKHQAAEPDKPAEETKPKPTPPKSVTAAEASAGADKLEAEAADALKEIGTAMDPEDKGGNPMLTAMQSATRMLGVLTLLRDDFAQDTVDKLVAVCVEYREDVDLFSRHPGGKLEERVRRTAQGRMNMEA